MSTENADSHLFLNNFPKETEESDFRSFFKQYSLKNISISETK